MFSYELPGGVNTNTYITPNGDIKFDPPVYEQRYSTVVRIIEDQLWNQQLKKVVDFGCSEMRLLPLIRRIPHVEHVLEVDIDEELLKSYQNRAVPLISDHLKKREKPLRVEVLKGSITDTVEQLCNVDAVIGIEIIEHLHKDVLDNVPRNVFGFIQPKLAIFSTPNAEFNVLFGTMLANGFRHYDHKFEWNRKEFESWARDVCKTYPNYSVSFMGVGKPPPGKEHLGHATQIAIFARNDMINKPLCEEIKQNIITPEAQYKVIYAVDYPTDKRSKEQKILDETSYYINQSKSCTKYFNKDRCIYQLPLKHLSDYAKSIGCPELEFIELLKTNKFNIEDDFIVLPEYDEDDYLEDPDFDGEYLDGEPYRYNPSEDEEEDELATNLASGCSVAFNDINYDTEEDWN